MARFKVQYNYNFIYPNNKKDHSVKGVHDSRTGFLEIEGERGHIRNSSNRNNFGFEVIKNN